MVGHTAGLVLEVNGGARESLKGPGGQCGSGRVGLNVLVKRVVVWVRMNAQHLSDSKGQLRVLKHSTGDTTDLKVGGCQRQEERPCMHLEAVHLGSAS